ncbi:hypothetical protein NKH23_32690 [Mesorhizobium sp. M1328]
MQTDDQRRAADNSAAQQRWRKAKPDAQCIQRYVHTAFPGIDFDIAGM